MLNSSRYFMLVLSRYLFLRLALARIGSSRDIWYSTHVMEFIDNNLEVLVV